MAVDLDVAEFRRNFQQNRVPRYYSGALHFGFIVTASMAVILYCTLHLKDVRTVEWLTIPLTFVYANIVEYLAHRGPMHHRQPGLGIVFAGHTLDHHHYFTHKTMELSALKDMVVILFPPVMLLFFLSVFAFPVAFVLGRLVSANTGYLFLTVAMAYYLNYELFHLAYHLPANSRIGRLPLMSRLRKLHTRHHDIRLMSRYCFNITYPLCDFLMGSLTPPHKDGD